MRPVWTFSEFSLQSYSRFCGRSFFRRCGKGEQMRCRLILLISEHPIQQGIRKGGVRHFCDGRGRGRTDGRTDRMAYSRQLDERNCETQPPASIGWVALSSVVRCSSRIGDISSHLHYMMFPSIQTIYFLWGYDPGNMSVSTYLLLLSWAQFTFV